jgi:hypothetical protein
MDREIDYVIVRWLRWLRWLWMMRERERERERMVVIGGAVSAVSGGGGADELVDNVCQKSQSLRR